jgi:electron transfer flavoprotein beta subunit
MKILVCVKQVPETESAILIDEAGKWIRMDHVSDFKMNRLDEYAVEEAVRLKEAFGDTIIDIISVGPDRSADAIRRAMGMGADHGIHIKVEMEKYLSSLTAASWISEQARNRNYTLILTGAMSEDNMQGQVGPMIAARLDLPCATGVIHERLSPETNRIYVEREIEGGNRDTLELQLPAVLTIQSGINTPRYPSLSNILRANKQKLETIHASTLLQSQFPEEVVQLVYPHKSRAGTILTGTQQKKAQKLLNILREKAFIE